jgi:hypothetical protein
MVIVMDALPVEIAQQGIEQVLLLQSIPRVCKRLCPRVAGAGWVAAKTILILSAGLGLVAKKRSLASAICTYAELFRVSEAILFSYLKRVPIITCETRSRQVFPPKQ